MSTTDVLNAWAADVVALETSLAEACAERDAYCELLSVALERLSAMTVAHAHQRERIANLMRELRDLRELPQPERRAA